MVDNEQLVELVIAEVFRRLGLADGEKPAGKAVVRPKVLTVLTGGTTGLETVMTELNALQANAELIVALSPAAEKIIRPAFIREKLGDDVALITTQSPYKGDLLQAVELVLVPVLTQNTAAKLALTIADTFVTTAILQALLRGKPVLAVPDAADPNHAQHGEVRTGKPAPALFKALQDNLKKLEAFGVTFVSSRQLAAEAGKRIGRPQDAEAAPVLAHKVIDAEAVRMAAKRGATTLTIRNGSIITPLARDIARECNIRLISVTC